MDTSSSNTFRPGSSVSSKLIPYLLICRQLNQPFRFQGSLPGSASGYAAIPGAGVTGPLCESYTRRDSILMTCAPISAISLVQYGPAHIRDRSSIL